MIILGLVIIGLVVLKPLWEPFTGLLGWVGTAVNFIISNFIWIAIAVLVYLVIKKILKVRK